MAKKYAVFQKDRKEAVVICTKPNLRKESRLRAIITELERIGLKHFYNRYTIAPTNIGYEVRYRHSSGLVALIIDAGN